MTPAQQATFRAAILADAALANARTAKDWAAVAAYYNANGSGSIWKPSVTVAQMNGVIDWTAFGAMTAVKQNTYVSLTQGGAVDATDANVRAAFSAIFTTGTTLAALTTLASRVPTRFEALFSANSVTTAYGQTVSANDVALALLTPATTWTGAVTLKEIRNGMVYVEVTFVSSAGPTRVISNMGDNLTPQAVADWIAIKVQSLQTADAALAAFG